jgi:hypothetical protein
MLFRLLVGLLLISLPSLHAEDTSTAHEIDTQSVANKLQPEGNSTGGSHMSWHANPQDVNSVHKALVTFPHAEGKRPLFPVFVGMLFSAGYAPASPHLHQKCQYLRPSPLT